VAGGDLAGMQDGGSNAPNAMIYIMFLIQSEVLEELGGGPRTMNPGNTFTP
jgi:hypothetical protein